MEYTVGNLAKLAGVSIRTLHHYDALGLLKPSCYGANGYRYYKEKELLLLQQILFFRELGFELKKIQHLLKREDFDQIIALKAHRQELKNKVARTQTLIQTIDETLHHLQGRKKMKNEEIYSGFSQKKQGEYEKALISQFGDCAKEKITESHANIKNWSKSDWERSKNTFNAICKKLIEALEQGLDPCSKQVEKIISSHYQWLSTFWKPNKTSYAGHGQWVVESDLRKAYEDHHPQLPEFIAKAIGHFAELTLSD